MVFPFKSVLFGFYQVMLCIPWSYSSISLFLSVLLPSLLWPCMFLFYPFSYPSLYHSYPLYHSIHPFLLIAFPHIQLCSIYHRCLVSIFFLSSLHSLQPISPQSPFQHLVFSLYHRWSTFHAGLLHALMPPPVFMLHVCYLYPLPAIV